MIREIKPQVSSLAFFLDLSSLRAPTLIRTSTVCLAVLLASKSRALPGPNARVRKRSALSARRARHPIAGSWLKIGGNLPVPRLLQHQLDLDRPRRLRQRRGDETPPMWIGLLHGSLLLDAAVAAANAIKGILGPAGFPDVGGPKLLSSTTPSRAPQGVHAHARLLHRPAQDAPRRGCAPAPSISVSAKTTTVSSFSPLPMSLALHRRSRQYGLL
jgi:hypothetical protein